MDMSFVKGRGLPFWDHLQCAEQLAYFISDSVSTLKVGIISPILQMRKLRLREAEKLAHVMIRSYRTRTCTENSRKAGFVFIALYPLLPSHGKCLTLIIK